MTDEVQNQEQEEVSQTTEQDDAGLEAGFAEARGEEPPTQEPTAEQPSAEPEPEPAAPEPEVVFAGLTEDQLKAALAKANEVDEMKVQLRQAFGKLGEFNSRIQQIQNAAAAGQPTKVTADQLKRLNANFPEFADDLAEDLSYLTLAGGVQQFDPTPMREELQQSFSAELDRIKKENETKLLSIRHRDWQTISKTDDFKLWQSTLPAEEVKALVESWDAMYLADKFDEFKAWR